MAKNRYTYEKRMKELARKKKKDDKRQRKLAKNNFATQGFAEQVQQEESETV